MPELFRRLKAAGLTISLDTNDDPEGSFAGDVEKALELVDIFLPNQREACRIAGTDNLEVAIKKLSAVVPLLVVKAGSAGAIAVHKGERIQSDALKVDVVDPVGAGDSFDAGFLRAYLNGRSLRDCLAAGNAAGALCATTRGRDRGIRRPRIPRGIHSPARARATVFYCRVTSSSRCSLNPALSFGVRSALTLIVPSSLLSA